jgi:hypothetical protein
MSDVDQLMDFARRGLAAQQAADDVISEAEGRREEQSGRKGGCESSEQTSRLLALEDRVFDLLWRAAKEIRPCKACGVTLYFIEHASGKIAPYTADAVNHFANCPEAKQFRRKA